MAQEDTLLPEMSTQLILETIDQLRKRKARPDRERIAHMMQRKHGITPQETETDLERLVDTGIVVKVDYKGNTSYRNAAKWRKSHMGHVINSNIIQSILKEGIMEVQGGPQAWGSADQQLRQNSSQLASDEGPGAAVAATAAANSENEPEDLSMKGPQNVASDGESSTQGGDTAMGPVSPGTAAELTKKFPDWITPPGDAGKGAGFMELEKWMRQRDPETNLVGKQLFFALKREVEAGRITRNHKTGNFQIGELVQSRVRACACVCACAFYSGVWCIIGTSSQENGFVCKLFVVLHLGGAEGLLLRRRDAGTQRLRDALRRSSEPTRALLAVVLLRAKSRQFVFARLVCCRTTENLQILKQNLYI